MFGGLWNGVGLTRGRRAAFGMTPVDVGSSFPYQMARRISKSGPDTSWHILTQRYASACQQVCTKAVMIVSLGELQYFR